jgi:hypothetical protein
MPNDALDAALAFAEPGPMVQVTGSKWIRAGISVQVTGWKCRVCDGRLLTVQTNGSLSCNDCSTLYRAVEA